MLLGKLGRAGRWQHGAELLQEREGGREWECSAFLPEGPVKFPETWAKGQNSCAEWWCDVRSQSGGVMLGRSRVKESPP